MSRAPASITTPRRVRLVLLACVTVVLGALVGAAPATATTGTITFVRGGDVWIVPGDDLAAARPVTDDGTDQAPYLAPSQDDHGRIVAIRGGERGDVVRMTHQGELLGTPFPLGLGNVQDLDVRSDGEVFAVATYDSHQTPQGFVVVPTVDFAYSDGRDPSPVANPAFDRATVSYSTARAFMITYDDNVPWVTTYGPGEATEMRWYRPCADSTAPDDGAFCFPLHVDVTTAQDRVVVAVPANEGWPVGSRLIVHDMDQPAPALPDHACELLGPEPDFSTQVHLGRPEWSPDGSSLVWEEQTVRDGVVTGSRIMVASGFDEGCEAAFAGATSVGEGSWPDWAAPPSGPAPTPDPVPSGPPGDPSDAPRPDRTDPTVPVGAFDGDLLTTDRVNASTPIAASLLVSRGRFADGGAARVVLSRDDAFPDSLAGAALSADGPLLFTPSTGPLHRQVLEEARRVLPPGGLVHILGGPAAVPEEVAQELRDAGFEVDRVAGASRVETALAVADRVRALRPDVDTVAIARAAGPPDNPTAGWADSVSGGAWAAATGVPVLVTDTAALHPAVAGWLAADDPGRTIVLGGTAAVSESVVADLPHPSRVSAGDRTGTAAAIATSLWGISTDHPRRFAVIDGFHVDGWAYGLAAAGLAADAGAPLLMVNGESVPQVTADLVRGCHEVDLALIGGGTVVTHPAGVQLHDLDEDC